jgi:hypothetical protein
MPGENFKIKGRILSMEISSPVSEEKFHGIFNDLKQLTAGGKKRLIGFRRTEILIFLKKFYPYPFRFFTAPASRRLAGPYPK